MMMKVHKTMPHGGSTAQKQGKKTATTLFSTAITFLLLSTIWFTLLSKQVSGQYGTDDCGGSPCWPDTCDEFVDCEEGACTHYPNLCEDNNICTNNDCDPVTGCVNSPINCDDADRCTLDGCDPQDLFVGCWHAPLSCDDGDPCTDDPACTQFTGCEIHPNKCNDGNPCTSNVCEEGGNCPYTWDDCDDNEFCTDDWCDPGYGGCRHAPKDCDDEQSCTDDSCNEALDKCEREMNCPASEDPCQVNNCNPVGDCALEDKCTNACCVIDGEGVCNNGNCCSNADCNAAACATCNGFFCGLADGPLAEYNNCAWLNLVDPWRICSFNSLPPPNACICTCLCPDQCCGICPPETPCRAIVWECGEPANPQCLPGGYACAAC